MKRVIAIILVFCMAFTVCACGGTTGSDAAWENDIVKSDAPANPTVMDLFYRNTIGADILSDDPAVKAVDEKADALLEKIEDYPDSLTPAEGGKTYYISAEGSDSNDGLTPETARQSYMAVKTFLKSGDVVLFRRGDIFRGQMKLLSGVSYGAYGEGPKPRIYGSVDGKQREWIETSTKGVYKYSEALKYANIVFNSGEAVGRPVEKLADITKKELGVYFDGSKIQVYSPNGNPGEIFDHIEIVDEYTVITSSGEEGGLKNVTLQNLCVMYGGTHCIAPGATYDLTIEGCVIGFAGGKGLFSGETSLGNAIELWGVAVNTNIHDNYIFQCFDTGITHQGPINNKTSSNYDNIRYHDNLIEYCVWSIEAWYYHQNDDKDDRPDNTWNYNKVYIENNIIRHSGWGWGSLDRPSKNVYSDIEYAAKTHVEPLVISGNIFDRPRRCSIAMRDYPDASLMVLTNNTFIVENTNTRLGSFGSSSGVGPAPESFNITDDYDTMFKKYFGTYSGNTFTLVK